MQELAQRITRLRLARGLSSERLAQKLGVSHKTVINWEKDRGDPSLENLLRIAGEFGVTPDYLLGAADATSGEGAELDPADAPSEAAGEGCGRGGCAAGRPPTEANASRADNPAWILSSAIKRESRRFTAI